MSVLLRYRPSRRAWKGRRSSRADSSHLGDSGRSRRKLHTITPPNEPATNSHLHPATFNGRSGTSTRASSPAAGTPMNPAVYAHAINLPRCAAGSTSLRYASDNGISDAYLSEEIGRAHV